MRSDSDDEEIIPCGNLLDNYLANMKKSTYEEPVKRIKTDKELLTPSQLLQNYLDNLQTNFIDDESDEEVSDDEEEQINNTTQQTFFGFLEGGDGGEDEVKFQVKGKKRFKGSAENGEISFNKGVIIDVFDEDTGDGTYFGRINTEETDNKKLLSILEEGEGDSIYELELEGWFPMEAVKKIKKNNKPTKKLPSSPSGRKDTNSSNRGSLQPKEFLSSSSSFTTPKKEMGKKNSSSSIQTKTKEQNNNNNNNSNTNSSDNNSVTPKQSQSKAWTTAAKKRETKTPVMGMGLRNRSPTNSYINSAEEVPTTKKSKFAMNRSGEVPDSESHRKKTEDDGSWITSKPKIQKTKTDKKENDKLEDKPLGYVEKVLTEYDRNKTEEQMKEDREKEERKKKVDEIAQRHMLDSKKERLRSRRRYYLLC